MRIGFYSGSFNPLHNGHLLLADYLTTHHLVEEVWLSVSPQNPLKMPSALLDDTTRLAMARAAVQDRVGVKICDIECHMPRPSYTIDTLRALRSKFPQHQFCLLIGADNATHFYDWHAYAELLVEFEVWVYPREGYAVNRELFPQMKLIDAPLCNISATEIRRYIAAGEPYAHLVPAAVARYIDQHRLYR